MRMYSSIQATVLCMLLPLVSCGKFVASDSPDAAPVNVLSSLTLSAAAPLAPAFAPKELSYSADVSVVVSEVRITATAQDANATILINGTAVDSGSASGIIALDLGINEVTIAVNAMETYTLSINRGNAVLEQLAYGKASNTDDGDSFGLSVSLSGNTLAVGASGEDSNASGSGGDQSDNSVENSGAVYVFTRTGSTWTQQAYLKASNRGELNSFGRSLSLSGDTLAVGTPQEDSKATGVDGDQNDNTAMNAGAVYVFTRTGSSWAQEAYLKASNTDVSDQFGRSVSLFGDTLAVGTPQEDSNARGINGAEDDNTAPDSGAVYVFARSGGTWAQQAYLKASNTSALGDTFFGRSVSLFGDTLAVGSTGEDSKSTGVGGDQNDDSAPNSGAVYVFARTDDTWMQQAYLKASNTNAGDNFGESVSLSGETLAVGAHLEDSSATGVGGAQEDNTNEDSGAVYVFTRAAGSAWTQQAYLKASNTNARNKFGQSVSLVGDVLAVGSIDENSSAVGVGGDESNDGTDRSGAAYVFLRTGSTWAQEAYVKASNTDTGDLFGTSVSLSGGTLVVGARLERSSATGIGGDESDNSIERGGAIYIFE